MIAPAVMVALVGVSLALLIAGRALRSHRLPARRLLMMALAWMAIIAGLAVALQYSGAGGRHGVAAAANPDQ